MDVETFKKNTANGQKIVLLDIREPEELLVSDSIPGAKNIPMGKVFTEAMQGNLPKDSKIIVFCRTGGRAEIVERELLKRGFDIAGLEGGLEAFRAS